MRTLARCICILSLLIIACAFAVYVLLPLLMITTIIALLSHRKDNEMSRHVERITIIRKSRRSHWFRRLFFGWWF